jgi:hypothetical protein
MNYYLLWKRITNQYVRTSYENGGNYKWGAATLNRTGVQLQCGTENPYSFLTRVIFIYLLCANMPYAWQKTQDLCSCLCAQWRLSQGQRLQARGILVWLQAGTRNLSFPKRINQIWGFSQHFIQLVWLLAILSPQQSGRNRKMSFTFPYYRRHGCLERSILPPLICIQDTSSFSLP